jgi:hypothetical protein
MSINSFQNQFLPMKNENELDRIVDIKNIPKSIPGSNKQTSLFDDIF